MFISITGWGKKLLSEVIIANATDLFPVEFTEINTDLHIWKVFCLLNIAVTVKNFSLPGVASYFHHSFPILCPLASPIQHSGISSTNSNAGGELVHHGVVYRNPTTSTESKGM